MDEINNQKSVEVVLRDSFGAIVIGNAKIHVTGDKILNTKKIELIDLKLLFKKGDIIYERA